MINSQLLASSLWSLVSLVTPPQQSSTAAPATASSNYNVLQSDRNTLAAPLSQRVQQILGDHHAKDEFPGAVVALRLANGTELLLTSGTQNTSDAAAAVDATIPWGIGSATKSFVAVTILQLAQEGSLELDQSVEAWLPSIPWASSITIRQLLQHTSGLADYLHVEQVLSDAKRPWAAGELIDVAVACGQVPGQGKQHRYSNTNYLALGLIIEAVTGKAWFEEVQTRILTPLGMKQTGYWGTPTAPAMGTGHCKVHSEFVDGTNRWHPSLGGAAGGMYSTACDLVRFSDALRSGDLLNEPSQLQMRSFIPADADEGVKQEYGLGLQRYTFDEVAMTGHLGCASAHSCFFGFDSKSGASIAVLVNRENGVPAAFMASEVLRAAAAESPASPQAPRPKQSPMPRPAPKKRVSDEPIPRGFHGSLQILAGATFGNPALAETWETEETIGSLTDVSEDRNTPVGMLIGELSYTLEDFDTQFFVGNSQLTTADMDAALEIGVRQLFADGTLLTAAYSPEIPGPFSQVWEDPFVTGSPRKQVDMTAQGARLAIEQAFGLPISIEYQFGRQLVENDRSGMSLGLTSVEVDSLRRDSDIQRFRISTPLPLSETVTLEPTLEYATAHAKGATNSFDSVAGGLELTYANNGYEWTVGAGFASADFDATDPIFQVTRSRETLQLSAGVCIDQPFGWESTRFDCLVMYSANESNIAFYESDQTIVAFGLTYEF